MMQEININPRIINFYGLKNSKGLFVISIEKNSPASRTALREGDIIIGFDNFTVNNSNELFKLLTKDKIEKPAHLTVIRSAQKLDISISPGLQTAA